MAKLFAIEVVALSSCVCVYQLGVRIIVSLQHFLILAHLMTGHLATFKKSKSYNG